MPKKRYSDEQIAFASRQAAPRCAAIPRAGSCPAIFETRRARIAALLVDSSNPGVAITVPVDIELI
ncbi:MULTISPECIES: hypothetical protein [Ruegeria]|uniref:hypothetical protein n=1 Tax=Ruegeria TaxID=97050 RepID=UPI00147AC0F0|nr:hypothetical protein [Ruegeria atlantica]